jgi:tRNA pseudouridine32 synthase/23S rRNA pseudouridine746 synthase
MYYSDTVLDEVPAPLTLIADENTYSLLYKPYGVRSQGSKWSDHCTVTRWAEQNLLPRRPAFPVHRLDRAASGLILVAHAKKTATALARQFEERSVEKRYRAIVHGRFQPTPEPKLLDAPIEGRDARTIVTLIAANSEGDRSLLDIVIETGRKHQIRRHLSDIGHPVIGDRMYGSPVQDQDLQLTAWLLAFTCPVSAERKTFQLPEERMPSL